MPRGTPKDITYLTPKERNEYLNKIKNAEQELAETKTSEFAAIRNRDKSTIVNEMNRAKQILEEKTPPNVSDRERNDRYTRLKIIEEKIKEGMPTKDEMMGKKIKHPDGSYHYEAIPNIVDKNIAWTLKNDQLVREWKRIKATLDPDNPSATNVEQLRDPH